MGDLDNNQFQPNIIHDITNDTVAPLGFENVAYHENNNVHKINNRKSTEEQRHRIVEVDVEKRTRGKQFMRRVKERWDTVFPLVATTAQNLIDSARRFRNEECGRPVMESDEVAKGPKRPRKKTS